MRIQDFSTFNAVREAGLAKLLPSRPRIAIGMGTCGSGNGAEAVYHAFASAIDRRGLGYDLAQVGCFGYCAVEPLVNIWLPGKALVILKHVRANDVDRILDELAAGSVPADLALCKIEEWDHITAHIKYGDGFPEIPNWSDVPFFRGQKKIVLRNCGLIAPGEIEEYFAVGGYSALYKVLIDGSPDSVIAQIKASKLRGRGGAGYQTGLKWEILKKSQAGRKFLICNADEGDPGAFMNRNEIESDPHSLLEGMIIGGYLMDATQGIVYVRAEYPLAVHRLNTAIEQAREFGLLGDNILGRGFRFDIELVEGAGAFVCGEETALIQSLEGRAGRPTPRPPYPAQKGLWGNPTNINNVETWFNIAPIVTKGPAWFTEIGSTKSAGTKVFSLVGKIQNTGLVEMPLGTPLKNFIYDVGGGNNGKNIKAVQTGGPSGGCVPQEMFDTPVDYETLAQLGSIMGSGGMVVMDDDNCMVDVARYFIEFTHSESCGKCVPCRVGLDKARQLLSRMTRGNGAMADLDTLDELSRMIRDTALCGLGQTAPNPVLTTMRHFRAEFEDHIRAHRCRSGTCEELALSPCENSCPLHINIPRFLQLYKEDRLEDAFESVILDNPLPASTGRVCQHPCDQRCRRVSVDEAVNMRDVHRFIADSVFNDEKAFSRLKEKVAARKLPDTGFKVAIAGSGPTGLTAAYYLALLGHNVTVYDANAEPGGMLRYAIPEYRLPRQVLHKEIEMIERLGVKFIFNTRLGFDIPLNDIDAQYDAVFLAIGTWKEAWVYLAGTELKGVMPALPFLQTLAQKERVPVGRKIAVIGGGNAAIDSARSARRLGAEVSVIYRRERKDMPAIKEETDAAQAEGVDFEFLAAPHRIIGDKSGRVTAIECVRTRLGEFDSSGRRRPILTEEVKRFQCDTVILAVGETVDVDFARASGLEIRENGTIVADRYTLQTSRPKFYAGGDLISGASNVSNAMGYGKRAASSIDHALTGQKRFDLIQAEFEYDQTPPPQPSETGRHSITELPAEKRSRAFIETTLGLSAVEAMEEANRCLRCDIKTNVH